MNDLIQTFSVYALPIVFAITLHEAAHAYAAKYFGDNTAYAQGRMSLNPIKHIDPIGTLLIPIVLYFAGSPFLFGYAKPVPVVFGNLRNPKKQMAFVAFAGPLANLVMALMWMVFGICLAAFGVQEDFFMRMAQAGVITNLVIFAFNLFPVPPLDGGRIVSSILPNRYAYKFDKLEPYGFFIVIGLVVLKVLHYWMVPVMTVAGKALQLLVFPLTFLLS
ncbi:MAG: site-2 protease family protein [Oxalicibacterium faecigallinarum]|uniref:Peptidase M50 n=1 Tax=Oxalicibacterium faecigallinarum TaxID=573741 RepID=A0A8J3F084_9BURK|nr:site-2 protease family protein [Oxalicibacterium faecigallinarum]MDQ7968538.1 site-2 protease family protein [Oxalicibacterium faecigallinarum]GGI17720.1 peptidase M50 [Oxalicibacterium faecigallinarum]